MKELLFMKPVFKEAVWGGRKLRDDFGYEIPSDSTGECWGIGAHKNGDCEIAEGTYKGEHLSKLWAEHPELFGNEDGKYGKEFPLLIKIIDAKSDLSIQVHPDNAYAKEHENGSLGKTECWYILDSEPGTQIVIGHYAKDKEELMQMVEEKRWKDLIHDQGQQHPVVDFQKIVAKHDAVSIYVLEMRQTGAVGVNIRQHPLGLLRILALGGPRKNFFKLLKGLVVYGGNHHGPIAVHNAAHSLVLEVHLLKHLLKRDVGAHADQQTERTIPVRNRR